MVNGWINRRVLLRSAAVALGPAVTATAPSASAHAALGVERLLNVPAAHRDTGWLRSALQIAVEIELATIPPYLCGWWSIVDRGCAAARLLRGIILDEMFHMGTVCNLLVAVGGTPRLVDRAPCYPGALPGGVRTHLTVYLSGLTKQSVRDVMMEIESPDMPLARTRQQYGVGDFYTAVLAAFEDVRPVLDPRRQLGARIGADRLAVVDGLDAVRASIETVKEQGEGTTTSPQVPFAHGTLAHYYAFGEIYHERELRRTAEAWGFSGPELPFPKTRPMGVVPPGGWPSPPAEVFRLLRGFDQTYTAMLRRLEAAWASGDPRSLGAAVGAMRALEAPAVALMGIPLPGGGGTYGPQFRVQT